MPAAHTPCATLLTTARTGTAAPTSTRGGSAWSEADMDAGTWYSMITGMWSLATNSASANALPRAMLLG